MRKIKTILKWLGGLILFLILVVSSVLFYAVKNPEKVWNLVESRLLPKDLHITWQDLEFSANHQSSRFWRPSILFKDLCMTKENPQISICLDLFKLQSDVNLKKIFNPEFAVHELSALSQSKNHVRIFKEPEQKPKQEKNYFEIVEFWRQRLHKWSDRLEIHKVLIDIDSFEFKPFAQDPLFFATNLNSLEFLKEADFNIEIKRPGAFELEFQNKLFFENFYQQQGPVANVQGKLQFGSSQVKVDPTSLAWKSQKILAADLDVTAHLKSKITIRNQFELLLNEKEMKLIGNVRVLGLKSPFTKLRPIEVRIMIPLEENRTWARQDSQFTASATIPFFVSKKLLPQMEKACQCDLPEEIGVEIKGRARIDNYFSKEDGFLAFAEAEIQSLTNKLFTTRNLIQAEVLRKDSGFALFPHIDSHLKVHSFQKLRKLLSTQNILIPAPLSVLDGTIEAAMKGPLERSAQLWRVPFQSAIKLGSERQNVDVQSNGFFIVYPKERKMDAQIIVSIRDLLLQLPPFDPIYGLPKLVKDSRFEMQPPKQVEKKKSKFQMRFFVQVKTENPESIRLLSSLADPAVPIDLNLTYETGKILQGHIGLQSFEIEYLKRSSTVEKLELQVNEPKGTFPVNGRFRVDQNPYRIYIDVLGTLKAPRIILSSEPYLDRSDIISVLLYGRTNDRLVAMDSKTVGSFDAALADRAIGLFGIWAFASTPIQSFSYNQLNQQYTAQVKVAEDTTLAVGTNWEESTSVELQKRLSEKWVLSASLEPTDEEEQTRKLRLQWENRF